MKGRKVALLVLGILLIASGVWGQFAEAWNYVAWSESCGSRPPVGIYELFCSHFNLLTDVLAPWILAILMPALGVYFCDGAYRNGKQKEPLASKRSVEV